MTREELIAYDKWLTRRKWGTGEIISPEKAADLYLAEHPLPPAEGAVQHLTDEEYQKPANQNRDHPIIGYKSVEHDQQPTAEGAEAYLRKHPFLLGETEDGKDYLSTDDIELIKQLAPILEEFATLHAQRIADKMVEEDDLQKLMNDISEWSDKTFGNGQRNPAIIYHLKKEVDELIAAIEKTNTLGSDPSVGVGEFGRQRTVTRVEYADCLMLLLDSAHHFGISAKELLSVTRGKLEINKVRKWGSPDENGVVEHIE